MQDKLKIHPWRVNQSLCSNNSPLYFSTYLHFICQLFMGCLNRCDYILEETCSIWIWGLRNNHRCFSAIIYAVSYLYVNWIGIISLFVWRFVFYFLPEYNLYDVSTSFLHESSLFFLDTNSRECLPEEFLDKLVLKTWSVTYQSQVSLLFHFSFPTRNK